MDWLDPNTWRTPAALLEDWRSILVGAVAIAGIVGGAFRRSRRWIVNLASKIRSTAKAGAERPLRFVQNEQQSFWGPAMNGQEPGTQIAGHWHVTNTSDRNVVILRARLDGYPCKHSHVATSGFRDRVYAAITPVPAESMAQVTANFFASRQSLAETDRLSLM
jgi:hypothetical protein